MKGNPSLQGDVLSCWNDFLIRMVLLEMRRRLCKGEASL